MRYGTLNTVLSEDTELKSFGRGVRRIVSIPIALGGAAAGGILGGIGGATAGAGLGALSGAGAGYALGGGFSLAGHKKANKLTGALGAALGAIPGGAIGAVAGAGMGTFVGATMGGMGTYALLNQDSDTSRLMKARMREKRAQIEQRLKKFTK